MSQVREAHFVHEYFFDFNASGAALRAGYKSGDTGYALLKRPHIQKAIVDIARARVARVEIKADEVLAKLKAIMDTDIREAYDVHGALKRPHEMSPELGQLISSIETRELWGPEGEKIGESVKVKFWSKEKALEMLAKHLGLLIERVDVSGQVQVTFNLDIGADAED